MTRKQPAEQFFELNPPQPEMPSAPSPMVDIVQHPIQENKNKIFQEKQTPGFVMGVIVGAGLILSGEIIFMAFILLAIVLK